MPYAHYEWEESINGKVEEVPPTDALEPLAKHAVVISYYDANLHHNMITGRSVTRVLHFVNKSPVEW